MMSHIEPMTDAATDEGLTFSFEEDRFYNYIQNAGMLRICLHLRIIYQSTRRQGDMSGHA